jgi:nitrogen-specific signal transduction histidine kinase
VDAEDRIRDVNPAAETFLNASKKSLDGHPVWDKIFVDAPLEEAFARIRTGHSALFVNAVDVGTGSRKPVSCDVQIAPLPTSPTMCWCCWKTGSLRAARPGHAFQIRGQIRHRHGRDAGPRDQEPAGRASPGRRSSSR